MLESIATAIVLCWLLHKLFFEEKKP